MKRRFLLAALAAVALAASACSSSGAGESKEAPFRVSGTPVPTTKVSLPKSYRFEPAVIQIGAGDTVTWTNEDNFPHNVHLLDGSDRTAALPIGESASITFQEPGTIYYQCSIHPQQMHGKIIVKEG